GLAKDAAVLKALIKANPKLRDVLKAQSADTRNIQFEAKDLNTGDNVDVTIAPGVLPKSLDEFRTETASQYSKIGGTLLAASTRRVAGKTPYQAGASVSVKGSPSAPISNVRVGELLIPHGNRVVEIAVTSDDTTTGQALIDSILGSVRQSA